MFYFCSWGPDCERLHDIVDEVLVGDDIGEQKFAGPQSGDVIMTTWHAKHRLEDAIDFFATCAVPTDGFAPDSDFRVVTCVSNEHWATEAKRLRRSLPCGALASAPQLAWTSNQTCLPSILRPMYIDRASCWVHLGLFLRLIQVGALLEISKAVLVFVILFSPAVAWSQAENADQSNLPEHSKESATSQSDPSATPATSNGAILSPNRAKRLCQGDDQRHDRYREGQVV